MDLGAAASSRGPRSCASRCPGVELFDAHTHLGQNDPDGMKQTPEQLLAVLDFADARGRVRVPDARARRLPAGQRHGDRGGRASSGGLLVPFCRVNPHDDAGRRGRALPRRRRPRDQAAPARRAVHARPSRRSATLVALADERRLPILIHAGRGIPALGLHAVELAGEFPDARLILAHAGDLRPVVDLARRARPPEPAVRHRLVDAGRPADAVLARARRVRSCSPATRPTAPRRCRRRSSSAPRCRSGSRPSRSARSPPSRRCGSPPASRCSRPARRSASASAPPHVLLDRVSEFLMLGAIASMRGGDGPGDAGARPARLRRARRDRRRARVRGDPRAARRLRRAERRRSRRPPPARVPDPGRDRRPHARRARPGASSRSPPERGSGHKPRRYAGCAPRSAAARSASGSRRPRRSSRGRTGPAPAARPPVAITVVLGTELVAQPPDDPVDLAGEAEHDPAADRVDGRLADQRARLRRAPPSAAWPRARTARRSRSRPPG